MDDNETTRQECEKVDFKRCLNFMKMIIHEVENGSSIIIEYGVFMNGNRVKLECTIVGLQDRPKVSL